MKIGTLKKRKRKTGEGLCLREKWAIQREISPRRLIRGTSTTQEKHEGPVRTQLKHLPKPKREGGKRITPKRVGRDSRSLKKKSSQTSHLSKKKKKEGKEDRWRGMRFWGNERVVPGEKGGSAGIG